MNRVYPFTHIHGQDELKEALILCAIDPGIGGVLAFGDRGTGKTTTVRALGQLLSQHGEGSSPTTPVIDVPLGVTEDRLIGSLDIDAALTTGEARFRPGLLADANNGFLYIDEINLLDDHLVDVLLDVAASGVNIVERDGISHTHPARFVLVGSGNPEEGDLRPQLQDRFGLALRVDTLTDPTERMTIVRERLAFDADPEAFLEDAQEEEQELAASIEKARDRVRDIELSEDAVLTAVEVCTETGCVGHRGELVITRAARARTALLGNDTVTREDVGAVALAALRHRVPNEAFEAPGDVDARLTRTIHQVCE